MKRLFYILIFLNAAFFFSCDNEIDIVGTPENTPIVYGMINKNDLTHQIRVQRAFIDKKTGAIQLAQDPDQLYYKDISVILTNKGVDYYLEKRNAGNKEDGTFLKDPNWVYAIDGSDIDLDTVNPIQLTIVQDEKIIASSETMIVGNYKFSSKKPANPMNFIEDRELLIRWESHEQAARVYNFSILFNYLEKNGQAGSFQEKTLRIDISDNIARKELGSTFSRKINSNISSDIIFKNLKANLEENSSIIREFKSMDLVVWAANEDYYANYKAGKINSGITSTQELPRFSNIENGYGLFTSRIKLIKEGFGIGSETRDSLQDGIYTYKLNFK